MVGQAFVGPMGVEVVVEVVVRIVIIVRAVGVAREVVWVFSRMEMRVEVVVFVEGGPGQRVRVVVVVVFVGREAM